MADKYVVFNYGESSSSAEQLRAYAAQLNQEYSIDAASRPKPFG